MGRLYVLIVSFSLLFHALAAAEQYRATVVRVVDGDTVVVKIYGKKTRLRLLDIDSPEKFHSRKLERNAAQCGVMPNRIVRLGKLATKFARTLIHPGDTVNVSVKTKDRYGRVLANLYLSDGRLYNRLAVREGYACTYRNRNPEYEILEHEAMKYRRGLWSLDLEVMECLCR